MKVDDLNIRWHYTTDEKNVEITEVIITRNKEEVISRKFTRYVHDAPMEKEALRRFTLRETINYRKPKTPEQKQENPKIFDRVTRSKIWASYRTLSPNKPRWAVKG